MRGLKGYFTESVSVVVAALFVVSALLYASSIYSRLEHVTEEQQYKRNLSWQMELAVRDRVFKLNVMLLLNDPFEREDRYEEFLSRAQDFMIAWRSFRKLSLSTEERGALEDLNRVAWRSSGLQREVIDLLQMEQPIEARRQFLEEVLPVQMRVFSAIEGLMYLQQHSDQVRATQITTNYHRAELVIVLSLLLLFSAGMVIVWGWRCNVIQMKQVVRQAQKEAATALQKQNSAETLLEQIEKEEKEARRGLSDDQVVVADHYDLRILVAEDNVVNQQVVTLMLEQLGYADDSVDVVADGVAVLDAVRAKDYDLIFMDLQMPLMGGEEATQKIVEDYPVGSRPRIVAMTASALSGDRERCLALGMDGYLSKPISLSKLSSVLAKIPSRGGGVMPVCRVVDVSVLEALRADMVDGAEVVVELLNNFFSESERLLNSLQQAVKEESYEKMVHAVHTLKSSSLSLGASPFSECCRILEQQIRQDKVVGLQAQMETIGLEYRRVCEDFNALLRYYAKQ